MQLNELNRWISSKGGQPVDNVSIVVEGQSGDPGWIFDNAEIYVDENSGQIIIYLDSSHGEPISPDEIDNLLVN
jgi:hypothetical protein